MKNKIFPIILGLIAIVAGVGYGLQAMGIIEHFTIFFRGWWTLFLIVPAFLSLFHRGSNKLFSIALLALGVGLLLWKQALLDDSVWKLVLPALAVIFGVSLIVGAFVGDKHKIAVTCDPIYHEDGSLPKYEVAFGEIAPNYAGKSFEGCHMDVSFGKGTLNLVDAVIEKDISISVDAAFSAVEIFLPTDCKLDLHTSASFGGTENNFTPSTDPEAYTVHIEANVSFGGLVIQ